MSFGVGWYQDALNFQVLAISCHTAKQRHGLAMRSLQVAAASLDVAVVVGTIGLGHVHFAHGVTDVVNAVFAGRHALIDAI